MPKKEWTYMDVYDLLCRIDKGYVPSDDEREMLTTLKSLDLWHANITALPKSFGQLSSLQSLDLSYNDITALPESFGQLSSLQSLNLRGTRITALPESFGQLSGLQSLDLDDTKITVLPESFGQLSSLQSLVLWTTPITALPESFGQLSNLQRLDLEGTPITALPESFGQLSGLQSLDLRSTPITALPESFGLLSKLESLHLVYSSLEKLPESFGQLSGLQRLYLGPSNLSKLPAFVCRLPSLRRLDLDSSKIAALPDAFEPNSNLQYLDLSNTAITRLPDSLGQLPYLEHLDIGNTQITALPEYLGQIPGLQYLDLRGLTLPEIPESLAKRGLPFVEAEGDFERGINLYGTTLTGQDKTVFLEHPELIPSLYEDQITLRESRVIFLGDGGVGKSYTIRRLQNDCKKETEQDPYITKQTPGIEIQDYRAAWDGDSYTLHLWDFGGQEILHSMHRCFLSDQTCYVVMVRTRDDANQKAQYWLRNVKAFAPNSPVLLFVNCWENADGRIIDESSLRDEFKENLADVVYCSAKEAEDDVFRTVLFDKLIGMVAASESSKRTVNRRWNAVRTAITEESKKAHYLTKERYRELCRENGIEDSNAPGLLSFFNSLGVCFSYHLDEEQNELEDYKLLNPVWLTNAIYAIIEEGWAQAQEGRIKLSAIEQMLGNKAPKIVRDEVYRRAMPETVYTKEQCRYVIDVAIARNLCYKVNKSTIFFPALCRNNTPDEARRAPEGYPQHVKYLLNYEYLPDSVVHQLMVSSMKTDLAVNQCWLRGMILGSMDAHKAIIHMDTSDKNLWIDIWSKPNHPAYEMFELLRREILEINPNLNLEQNPIEFIVDGEDQFSLISLFRAEQGAGVVYGQMSGREYNAAELLGRFYEDWTLKFTQVEDGKITIPILPRTFHPCKKSDPALRWALYQAYHKKCPFCNDPIITIEDMDVDHIFPSKYKNLEELTEYVKYLRARSFDTDKPDYVENYFIAHHKCNNKKRDFVEPFALLSRHEYAYRKTPEVLRLYKKYKG